MSHAVVCDQCGASLILDRADGEDEYGERSVWVSLSVADENFDVCSLSCAHEWLKQPEVTELIASHLEVIAEVRRTIRGENTE